MIHKRCQFRSRQCPCAPLKRQTVFCLSKLVSRNGVSQQFRSKIENLEPVAQTLARDGKAVQPPSYPYSRISTYLFLNQKSKIVSLCSAIDFCVQTSRLHFVPLKVTKEKQSCIVADTATASSTYSNPTIV